MHFFSKTVHASFDDTVLAIKDSLKRHGFETLAEIDMRKAFKRHGVPDFRPYLILSACDPALAHRAVQINDEIASVLFCNVVVQQLNAGSVGISTADPNAIMRVAQHVDLDRMIQEIRGRIQAAIEEIGYRLGPISAQESRRDLSKRERLLESNDGPLLLSSSTPAH